MRAIAWGVVVAGAAAPLARHRVRTPRAAVVAASAAAPFALAVAVPRSRRRDVGVCVLQMWAYVNAYEMPHDDPGALRARVHVDYPVAVDRVIGFGRLPSLRLQRGLAAIDRVRPADQVLVWAHWLWFLVPHGSLLYILVRRPERFPRAAVMTYAVFDLGLIGYWTVPTAPPWYAAREGRLGSDGPELRRLMAEHGQAFWKDAWAPLYDLLGGNPLAAMPSLHFATSVMAAHLLAEHGPVEGAAAWTYAVTLGFALVYLGEHYVIDLIAGLALTQAVRRSERRAAPVVRAVGRTVSRLEAMANPA